MRERLANVGVWNVSKGTPKLMTFSGKEAIAKVKNFLWHIKCYSKGAHITNELSKVHTTLLYLSHNTMLWWHRKHLEIENKKEIKIKSFEAFKQELKKHFLFICPS